MSEPTDALRARLDEKFEAIVDIATSLECSTTIAKDERELKRLQEELLDDVVRLADSYEARLAECLEGWKLEKESRIHWTGEAAQLEARVRELQAELNMWKNGVL